MRSHRTGRILAVVVAAATVIAGIGVTAASAARAPTGGTSASATTLAGCARRHGWHRRCVPSPTTSTTPSAAATATPSASTSTGVVPPEASTAAPTPTNSGPPPAGGNTSLPVRATFYYPWYPENFQGNGSKYTPSAGLYNGDDPVVVDRQIGDMQYANLQAGIASWWGQGTREDKRLALLMAEATKLHFSWAAYYEQEGFGDPSAAQITSDLTYLRKYSDSPTWLHINNKPVIFAYGDGTDDCSMTTRWKQANTVDYYVVLKVFGGYQTCADQPQGWHQYAPGGNIDVQNGYSVTVSPGFFRNDASTPLLARDPTRFRADVTTLATSKAPFQLITTFNEWGEGTSIESTTEWPSADGHGQYIDILHDVFSAHPR